MCGGPDCEEPQRAQRVVEAGGGALVHPVVPGRDEVRHDPPRHRRRPVRFQAALGLGVVGVVRGGQQGADAPRGLQHHAAEVVAAPVAHGACTALPHRGQFHQCARGEREPVPGRPRVDECAVRPVPLFGVAAGRGDGRDRTRTGGVVRAVQVPACGLAERRVPVPALDQRLDPCAGLLDEGADGGKRRRVQLDPRARDAAAARVQGAPPGVRDRQSALIGEVVFHGANARGARRQRSPVGLREPRAGKGTGDRVHCRPGGADGDRRRDAGRRGRAAGGGELRTEPAGAGFRVAFHLAGEASGPYTYGRDTNPTWTLLEGRSGSLKAAPRSFPSRREWPPCRPYSCRRCGSATSSSCRATATR